MFDVSCAINQSHDFSRTEDERQSWKKGKNRGKKMGEIKYKKTQWSAGNTWKVQSYGQAVNETMKITVREARVKREQKRGWRRTKTSEKSYINKQEKGGRKTEWKSISWSLQPRPDVQNRTRLSTIPLVYLYFHNNCKQTSFVQEMFHPNLFQFIFHPTIYSALWNVSFQWRISIHHRTVGKRAPRTIRYRVSSSKVNFNRELDKNRRLFFFSYARMSWINWITLHALIITNCNSQPTIKKKKLNFFIGGLKRM